MVTSLSSSDARQSVHAAGPAALASASVRARNRSRLSRLPPTARDTIAMVCGSSPSRRVARSMRVRCSRTSWTTSARSSSPTPSRWSTRSAIGAPVSEWSREPGTLPMSCSSAARRSRSGRLTSRSNPLARTTVSMRWRSTVCRWTALRCGRLRTAAHSGIHFSTTPARSSPSQTETSPGPVASRSPNTASAAGGHGVGIGGQFFARFCRVVGAMLTLLRAATSAARSTSSGLPVASTPGPRTASPSERNSP